MRYKLIGLGLLLSITACHSIKPYERIYLNDDEMQLSNSSSKNFESYVQSIREGATPASSSKSSGGCGCN